MVSRLNLTFRKLLLISALTVVLVVSLAFALDNEFKPEDSVQIETASPVIQSSNPPGLGHLEISAAAYIYVFAYQDDGFVQASVTITGPDPPNPRFADVISINATTLNGTTSTDLQNPLMFRLWPGVYHVVGMYASSTPRTAIINATYSGTYGEVILNFGSSSPPPLGHIILSAWYWGESGGSFVQASITITGPESLNGTTRTDDNGRSVFTVTPGVYSIVGAYGSAPLQNATAKVVAGGFAELILAFNGRGTAW